MRPKICFGIENNGVYIVLDQKELLKPNCIIDWVSITLNTKNLIEWHTGYMKHLSEEHRYYNYYGHVVNNQYIIEEMRLIFDSKYVDKLLAKYL